MCGVHVFAAIKTDSIQHSWAPVAPLQDQYRATGVKSINK